MRTFPVTEKMREFLEQDDHFTCSECGSYYDGFEVINDAEDAALKAIILEQDDKIEELEKLQANLCITIQLLQLELGQYVITEFQSESEIIAKARRKCGLTAASKQNGGQA